MRSNMTSMCFLYREGVWYDAFQEIKCCTFFDLQCGFGSLCDLLMSLDKLTYVDNVYSITKEETEWKGMWGEGWEGQQ